MIAKFFIGNNKQSVIARTKTKLLFKWYDNLFACRGTDSVVASSPPLTIMLFNMIDLFCMPYKHYLITTIVLTPQWRDSKKMPQHGGTQ